MKKKYEFIKALDQELSVKSHNRHRRDTMIQRYGVVSIKDYATVRHRCS